MCVYIYIYKRIDEATLKGVLSDVNGARVT